MYGVRRRVCACAGLALKEFAVGVEGKETALAKGYENRPGVGAVAFRPEGGRLDPNDHTKRNADHHGDHATAELSAAQGKDPIEQITAHHEANPQR